MGKTPAIQLDKRQLLVANTSIISVKAPARVCLFGDHQDYLGLPIIACAISRFIQIEASEITEFELQISFLDTNEAKIFSLDKIAEYNIKGDFLAAAIKCVLQHGFKPVKGYKLNLFGNIPINAGVSSSSAMVVAFTKFLLDAFKGEQEVTDSLVAQIAYEAEVLEQKGPGGKMDQFTCALGGLIHLETDENSAVTHLPMNLSGLVLGESGIPKNTVGLLGDLRAKALDTVQTVKEKAPLFSLQKSTLADYQQYKSLITESEQPYFYAAIKNHEITKKAKIALQKPELDYQEIGFLMNEHHKVLRDELKITLPKIDAMINGALKAGAFGAKIVGSGGGGSICAICPPEKQDSVINAIKLAGGEDAYGVEIYVNE